MYDKEITTPCKKQIIQIWEKFIGAYFHSPIFSYIYYSDLFVRDGKTNPQILVWRDFYEHFNEEAPPSDEDFFQWCCDYLLKNKTEKIIPLIEITFNYMVDSDQQVLGELNQLFESHALPYRFAGGKIQNLTALHRPGPSTPEI